MNREYRLCRRRRGPLRKISATRSGSPALRIDHAFVSFIPFLPLLREEKIVRNSLSLRRLQHEKTTRKRSSSSWSLTTLLSFVNFDETKPIDEKKLERVAPLKMSMPLSISSNDRIKTMETF